MSYIYDEVEVDGINENFGENVDIDEIESSTIFLLDAIFDATGSMSDYRHTMEDCLQHFKKAISDSKQGDEILVAKTLFEEDITTGGYVHIEDFDTSYYTNGCTRLYDSIIERYHRLLGYIDDLNKNGTNVRAAMVILTDGKDNWSSNSMSAAKKAIEDLHNREITVAFIGFGPDANGIAGNLGVYPQDTIEAKNDEKELRRIMHLVSKSAISASKKASAGASSSGGFFDV